MTTRKLYSSLATGIVVLTGLSAHGVTITQLNSPAEFTAPTTTIDFDGFPDDTCANTLFSGQGIEFSRDDGLPVPISDWEALDRITTSRPNVIATISGSFECGSAFPFVTDLNVTFDSPTSELGAFFGNDQGFGGYDATTLSVFDIEGGLLGSVVVPTNNNVDVDQFIGLSSDVPFFSARFDNNGTSLSVVLDDVTFASPVEDEACCFEDGSCQDLPEDDCLALGGTPQGPNGDCASTDCPIDCSAFPCGNNNNKVLLCHVPPGNPANEHTICISPNAVPAHLANHPGDHCGPCQDDDGLAFGLSSVGSRAAAVCPADINGDGSINVLDLIEVLLDFGTPGGPSDINGDGATNVLDLIDVLLALGTACP